MRCIYGGWWVPLVILIMMSSSCTADREASAILNEQFRVTQECIESIGARDGNLDSNMMVVAGHGYGSPGDTNLGLYPPLLDALRRIDGEASVLALTGDISRSGTLESFKRIKAELQSWPLVLIAPGNHDVGSPQRRAAFERSFGPTWGSLNVGDVLVLRLDTDLDDWRISGDQLAWLEDKLRSPDATDASAIVVLTHHLVWSRGDRSDIPVNAGPRDPSTPRDLDQLQNLLEPLGKPSLVISGDTGAFSDVVSLACDQRGIVSYVASGVGGGLQDAVLAVDLTGSLAVRVCRLDEGDLTSCITGDSDR